MGSFGFGVIVTLPVCIAIPPKAEFCTRKEKSMEIRARPETVLFYLYKL
nr:MAG TPA: hypothetical protein [Caudoviricetes sp.]